VKYNTNCWSTTRLSIWWTVPGVVLVAVFLVVMALPYWLFKRVADKRNK
jgi:hypothetical protein